MNLKRFVLFSVLSLALAQSLTPALADEALTIKKAVEGALQKNSSVQKLKEKIEGSGAQISLAYATVFPTLSATLQGDRKQDAPASKAALFGGESYNYYFWTLQAVQPLYLGGGAWAALGYAQKDQEIQKLELEIALRDTTLKVVTSFYEILLKEGKARTLKETEKNQEELLKTAQARYQVGREDQLTVLQMKTQLALLAPKILQAEDEYKIAAAELATLIGETDRDLLDIRGKLQALDFTQFEAKIPELKKAELPELEKITLLRAQFQNQRSVTLAKHMPSVRVVGSMSTGTTEKANLLDSDYRSWAVGLQLQIPLFSGLSSYFERSQLSSQAKQIEFDEKTLRDNLALEYVRAQKNLEQSQKVVATSESAFKLADEASRVAKRTYRLGTTTYQQLFQTQNNLLDAEMQLLQAKRDSIIATAKYLSVAGRPLESFIDYLDAKEN